MNLLSFIWVKSVFGLKSEASRTSLSYLWWVLEPALQILVYFLVFGILLTRPDYLGRGGAGFLPFLVCGVLPWTWFSRIVTQGTSSIFEARAIVLNVKIPKVVFPAAKIVQASIKSAFVLCLLVIFLKVIGIEASYRWLLSPLVLLVEIIFASGVAFWFAALVPFIQDLRYIVNLLIQLLMFSSGVFYDPNIIAPELVDYFYLNPMASLLEVYRSIFLYEQFSGREAWMLCYVAIIGVVLLVTAIWFMKKNETEYPRLLAS